MYEHNGARRQTTLHPSPIKGEYLNKSIPNLRGLILPNGVRYKDQTGAKQTVVDIYLYDFYPSLFSVPLMRSKINMDNGEEWSPEPGDLVVVSFLDGDFRDPVVIGCLPSAGNNIDSTATEAPRSHRKRNGTSEIIDKVGNLIRKVVGYVSDTIDGNRTTIIEGNDETTVTSGDLTITVSAGKCTVDIAGKTAWSSDVIEFDGGGGGMGGGVNENCICAYTRMNHPMVSSTVKFTL